jgi:hypothetical protein
MILGLSLSMFTTVHAVISLIGIFSGVIVVIAMIGGRNISAVTALFLLTTALTSITGFMFPKSGFTPAQGVGYLSLVAIAAAIVALYVFHLAGVWCWVYVIATSVALYFNVFVATVQSFQKLSFLQAFAPTQSEPPFVVAQVAVLVIFIASAVSAVRMFHPQAGAA